MVASTNGKCHPSTAARLLDDRSKGSRAKVTKPTGKSVQFGGEYDKSERRKKCTM